MVSSSNAQSNSFPPEALTADLLLDTLPWGVLVVSEQGLIQRANQQAARWGGAAPADLLGRPLAEASLPAALRAALERFLEPGADAAAEVFLPALEQWVALAATRQAGSWVVHGQDITPQRQREQQYQALADNTPDVLTRWGPDLRLRYANAAFVAKARQPLAAGQGRTLPELGLPAEVAGPYEAALRRVFDTGQPQEHYHAFATPWEPVQYYVRMVPEVHDGRVETVLSIGRDITRLRQAEAEALRASEARLRAFVNTTADTVYEISADWHQMYVLTGKSFLEPTSQLRTDWLATCIPGEEQPRVWQAIQRAIATRSPFELEHRIIRSDNTVGWTASYAMPLLDGAGNLTKWFGTARDITARKHDEQQQAFLLRLNEGLSPLAATTALADTACRLLVEQLNASQAQYTLVEGEPGMETGLVGGEYIRRGRPLMRRYHLAEYGEPLVALLREGQALVLTDAAPDSPLTEAQRALHAATESPAAIAIPLVKLGRLVAVFTVHATTPRQWAATEVALVKEVAERTWAAVEQGRAKQALRRSEEKLRTLFDSIDEGYCLAEVLLNEAGQPADLLMLEANQVYQRQSSLGDVVGKRLLEFMPTVEPEWLRFYGGVALTGVPARLEHYAETVDRWYTSYASRVGGAGSRQLAIVFDDITERKRHEANLVFLNEVSADLTQLTDLDALMQTLCAKVGQFLGASACTFAPGEGAAGTVARPYAWCRADASFPLGCPPRLDEYCSAEGQQALRAGRPEVVRDAAACPPEAAARLAALGIGAFVSLPFVHQGAWLFTLSVFAQAPRDWRPDELALLGELTTRLWTQLERARAEQAVRDSEQKFRTLADTAPALIWFNNNEGRNQFVNQHFLDYVGYAAESVQELAWDTLVHPNDAPAYLASYLHAVQAQQPWQHRTRVRRHDGAWHWFENYAQPLFDQSGRYLGHVGVSTDVTASVEAQQQLADFNQQLEQQVAERTRELQASRDLFQSIFDKSLTGMAVLEAVRAADGTPEDFVFTLTNQEQERLAGRNDLVGQRFMQLYPGSRQNGGWEMMLHVLETGQPQQAEFYYPHDGFNHWFVNLFVKLDDGIVATVLDITARKRAEAERFRNMQLLEQAEEVAGLGSWDYNPLTGEFLWSDGMYQLFNLAPGQEVSPSIYLQFVVDEDRPRAEQLVQAITAGTGNFEQTLRLRVGAEVRTVRVKAVLLRNEAGQPVRMLGVDLNISELQRLEAENLRLRLAQQQDLFEAVQGGQEEERRRIAESLHDGLGQVLYATKLQLDLLPPLPEHPARQEAARLLTDAIRLTRALSHELTPSLLEEFGLQRALEVICQQLPAPGLRWRCHIEVAQAPALPRALQLAVYRLAQTLAHNVAQHARASEAVLEAEILPAWVVLRVEDNGVGFDPATVREGLGLRTLRSRVALLKGRVQVDSSPGQGTQILVRLPLPQ